MQSLETNPATTPAAHLAAPPIDETPLPLERLFALLPNDHEHDARWGARRQGERIPFCKPIALTRVELVDGEASALEVEALFDGWALNVCHGGMRIITEEPLRTGDRLQVEVTSSGTPYLGRARVAWVRSEHDGVIAGLEFAVPE